MSGRLIPREFSIAILSQHFGVDTDVAVEIVDDPEKWQQMCEAVASLPCDECGCRKNGACGTEVTA